MDVAVLVVIDELGGEATAFCHGVCKKRDVLYRTLLKCFGAVQVRAQRYRRLAARFGSNAWHGGGLVRADGYEQDGIQTLSTALPTALIRSRTSTGATHCLR